MVNRQRPLIRQLLPILFLISFSLFVFQNAKAALNMKKKVTIVCYMNGDNNLAGEVLHAVDMMETVGSSENVDIVALVDGAPGDNGGYGPQWGTTRLLHITKDEKVGEINSRIVAEMGEQNLGDPQVLEEFIKTALHYPSEKYVFVLFAHGRGIINTKSLSTPAGYKSVLLSPDETDQRAMDHREFKQAIENGLSGEKFELMLFFSCLTNMVEVGYELRELTRYMIGSQDEIRLVNEPAGSHQIRGIESEILMEQLTADSNIPTSELGKATIDSFINQYAVEPLSENDEKKVIRGEYPASLAMVDCGKYDMLSRSLDALAQYLIGSMASVPGDRNALGDLHSALTKSQNYPSFLNLEYFDLRDLLEKLRNASEDNELKRLCRNSLDILSEELVVYERHTEESRSHGVSIFFPNYLVPENIYEAHMAMYDAASFSRETSWGELIKTYRGRMTAGYTDLLIDEFERNILVADGNLLDRLHSKISWALREDVLKGKYLALERYLDILETTDNNRGASRSLLLLQSALQQPERNSRLDEMRKTVDVLLDTKNASNSGA